MHTEYVALVYDVKTVVLKLSKNFGLKLLIVKICLKY